MATTKRKGGWRLEDGDGSYEHVASGHVIIQSSYNTWTILTANDVTPSLQDDHKTLTAAKSHVLDSIKGNDNGL